MEFSIIDLKYLPGITRCILLFEVINHAQAEFWLLEEATRRNPVVLFLRMLLYQPELELECGQTE